MKKQETKETKITVNFGEDGISVEGVNTSQADHVIGILAMVSSLITRCGGDPDIVNDAISVLAHSEEDEDPEPEIKIKKLDLSDKKSVEEFIEVLKEASK